MAKAFGSVNKNENKTNDKQPDLKGYVKIGGFTGQNAEQRNMETAQWLKNITTEYNENNEVYINIAMWKRVDQETQKPYFSVAFEDNSWKTKSDQASKQTTPTPQDDDDDFNI